MPRPIFRVFLDRRLGCCIELLRVNISDRSQDCNHADTDRAGAHYTRPDPQFSPTRANRPLNLPPRSITKQSLITQTRRRNWENIRLRTPCSRATKTSLGHRQGRCQTACRSKDLQEIIWISGCSIKGTCNAENEQAEGCGFSGDTWEWQRKEK